MLALAGVALRREHPIAGPAAIAFIVTVIILIAVFIVQFPTIGKSAAHGNSSPPPSASPACAAGSLTLIGSSAFGSLAQAAAGAYIYHCRDASITVSYGDGIDSEYGLLDLARTAESRSPSAGSVIAMYDGLSTLGGTAGLKPHPVGMLIFYVVAHSGLFPEPDVTTAELRDIYASPGVQGRVSVGFPAGSGSRQAFITNVLGLRSLQPAPAECPAPAGGPVSDTSCTEPSPTGLLGFVNGTPNAVGYTGLTQSRTGYPNISVLSINGAEPTRDNVLNGSYRFWIAEHLYTTARPTPLATDFLEFLSRYLETTSSTGFIPCSAAPKSLDAGC